MFSVWEKDAKDEHGFLGYCHLDLFPRDNKYGHAAVWPLIAGYESLDGKRNYPVVAMVANLAKPTPNRPALMRHDDVVTFFHEMGHVFHGLLSRTRYARFHGTRQVPFLRAQKSVQLTEMRLQCCWRLRRGTFPDAGELVRILELFDAYAGVL